MKELFRIVLVVGVFYGLLYTQSGCDTKTADEMKQDIADGKFDQAETLAAFEADDYYRREVAAQNLAKFGDKEVIEPLIRHMHSDTVVSVRKMCVSGLLSRDDVSAEKLVPELIKLFKNEKDENIRQKVVYALGEKRNKEGYNQLLEALKDPTPEVRREAVAALAKFQDKAALTEIGKMLDDEDVSVRRDAIDTIAEIGGADAVDLLIKGLSNSDFAVQKTAVEKIGELKARKAGQDVVPLLNTDNAALRESAAKTLGILREAGAIEPLIKMFDDEPNIDTKRSIANALGMIGGPEVIVKLTTMLDHGDSEIREIAIDSIAKMKADSQEIRAKLNYISGNDPVTRLRGKAKEVLDNLK